MFFSLSNSNDTRFCLHDRLGPFVFSHDAGWNYTANRWSKGYRDPDNLGNWIELSWDGESVHVEHSVYRSFPLWWNSDSQVLTNLLGTGEPIWARYKVSLSGAGIKITDANPVGTTELAPLSLESAVDKICDRLVDKAQSLKNLDTSTPKKLFLTGGIDTLVLYSLMKYTNIDVELVDYEYIKYDRFLNQNLQNIKKQHWAYRQIHHWDDPTIFITGGCGDEFLFRGPTAISLWCAWNDINLGELLDNSLGYHVGYFKKEKNLKVFREDWDQRLSLREKYQSSLDLLHQILDINLNDHQHWHLGETLTWTPFLDLEFTKIVLSMDKDDILKQVIDAEVNRRVIEKFHPAALILLSDTKNDNSRSNLHLLAKM